MGGLSCHVSRIMRLVRRTDVRPSPYCFKLFHMVGRSRLAERRGDFQHFKKPKTQVTPYRLTIEQNNARCGLPPKPVSAETRDASNSQ
jgi:hypothetical protein